MVTPERFCEEYDCADWMGLRIWTWETPRMAYSMITFELTLMYLYWQQWTVGPGTQSPDYPIPGGINVTSCEEPLRDGGPNQTTFQVPSSSNAVLLFANGPWIHGSVRVTSTSAQTDSVKFSVDLSSQHNREADTIVCSLERGNGEKGVGIFVSALMHPMSNEQYPNMQPLAQNPRHERRQPWDVIRYDVVVTFPEDHPVIKRFESSVINSVYEIDDLRGKILFEALSLHGTNGGIYSKVGPSVT